MNRVSELPRRAGGRRWGLIVAALAVGMLAWPVATVAPATDIDSAWQAGLAMADADHLQYGREVVFTGGPLGFLAGNGLWYRPTALAAWVFLLAGLVGLVAVLIHGLRRWMPLPAAAAVAMVVTSRVDRPAPDIWALVAVLVAVSLAQSPCRAAVGGPVWLAAGVLLAALELLTKFSSGLYVLVVLVVAAGGLAGGTVLRRLATAGVAALLTADALILGWVILGQPLDGLKPWLVGSYQISAGYGAMVTEAPHRQWDFLFLSASVALLVWLLVVRWSAPRRVVGLVVVAVASVFEILHGLIRHNSHVAQLFLFLAVVPLVLRLDRRARTVAAAASGVALAGLLNAGPLPLAALANPVARADHAVAELADITSPTRSAQVQAAARQQMRDQLGIGAPLLRLLSGSTVQVDPWDSEVAWAYGLDWRPVPVMQSYAAYTPGLDALDAAVLRSAAAPRVILRARHGSVDGRFVDYESPRYYLNELCLYRQAALTSAWQVLVRGPDRCGAPALVARTWAVAGQPVAVPAAPRPGDAVYATIDLPSRAVLGTVTALLDPGGTPQISLDGSGFRPLVAVNAGGPLLMSEPAWVPPGPGSGGTIEVREFALAHVPGPFEISFYEVPIGS